MSMYKSFKSNVSNFTQNSAFLARPRLHKLLENAVNYPVVAVYAGSGYGKTRTVYSFLQEYNAYTTWIQLTERDNIAARFWEKYTHMISLTWPDIGTRLAKIGFPESEAAFAKCLVEHGEMSSSKDRLIMVYDDFHLLQNSDVLIFFERMANNLPPNETVILISRTTPEINLVGMMLHERICTILEDALCFTENEIADYFNQLALHVTRQDIHDIYDDTHGWVFAINLIGRSLSKDMKYERHALLVMKENVFKLIESEISHIKDKPLWHFLLRISLIGHLAASLIKTLTDDDALIKELDQLNAYIRYDHNLGVYRIHDLFLDYLCQYQYMLPERIKCDTYRKAGIWCESNNYREDALSYYEKAGDYDAIIRVICQFTLEISQDTARYAMGILIRMPEDAASRNPLFPAMYVKMQMCLGLLNEASASAEQFVKKYKTHPETPEKNRALLEIYNVWSVLRLMMSPYTNLYDFDIYFRKMRNYYDKAKCETISTVTNRSVGTYALLIGTNSAAAPEEFIGALKRAIPHSSHVLNGKMSGLDDLAQGELYFCQRELNSAEQYFSLAIDKARAKGQYDIQSRTIQYLMLIAFSRGEIETANKLLKQSEALLEISEFATRYEAYDITRSYYYLTLNQPDQVSDWLKSDFEKYAHPAFVESYANHIRGQYHFQTRQFNKLLAFLENDRAICTLLLGKIEYGILEALSLYQLKQRNEAIIALTKAYLLAEPNNIIILFTRYAKDMRTLTDAAIKDPKCTIPKPWLENINRKSSAFARRLTYMISQNKTFGSNEEKVNLSNRETKVLHDLAQGLSRSEIAASQNISVNTVKMVVNSIYDKFGVTNLHDAIRIAIMRNIV